MTASPSSGILPRLSLFESGDALVGLKSSAATAELGRPSATFSTDTSRTELLPMSFMVNGRYQMLEALGEGGVGMVYRVADQLHPERALALKTIRSAMLTTEGIKLFKAEFRTMADLCHPNVATVYDFEPLRDGVDYLFTMEHVDGADLMAATRGAGQERVVGLVVQICRALSYLHSRGIVHFDLKPANILVRSDDTVKVLDFGLVGSDSYAVAWSARRATWRPSWSVGGPRSITVSISTVWASSSTSCSSATLRSRRVPCTTCCTCTRPSMSRLRPTTQSGFRSGCNRLSFVCAPRSRLSASARPTQSSSRSIAARWRTPDRNRRRRKRVTSSRAVSSVRTGATRRRLVARLGAHEPE